MILVRIKKHIKEFIVTARNSSIYFAFFLNLAQYIGRISSNKKLCQYFYRKKDKYELKHLRTVCCETISQYENCNSIIKMNKISSTEMKVWVFWWKGIDDAPQLVKSCVSSIIKYSAGHEVVILDKDNYFQYAKLPPFIVRKHDEGLICHAHFSDIIRFNLLANYGGVWLDSTILVTCDLPNELFSNVFYTACLPDYSHPNISKKRWTGFFLCGDKQFPLFDFLYKMLLEYWSKRDSTIDYLFFDYMIAIAYEVIPFVKETIDSMPRNNPQIFDMMEQINLTYTDELWNQLTKDTYLHKLCWHRTVAPKEFTNDFKLTMFGYILKKYQS